MSRTKDRFPTRRQWHNTMIVAWVIPPALLVGVLIFASLGKAYPMVIIAIGLVIGMLVALMRDIGTRCIYHLSNGVLYLASKRHRAEIDLSEITDVSLIDRSGARAYIKDRLNEQSGMSKQEKREAVREFTRFCTVDIGFTSYTMGIGRYFTDRLPNAKRDVLLVRLKDGSAKLLSPEFNQEMVSALTRGARRDG